MILSHNQIVGRKSVFINNFTSIFLIFDAKNNGATLSVIDNMSVNNFQLYEFIILNGISTINKNIQVYVYENKISTQLFLESSASVYLDTFEFIATRDNIVNLID